MLSAGSLNAEPLAYLRGVEQLCFPIERGASGVTNYSSDEVANGLGLLVDFNLVSGSDIEFLRFINSNHTSSCGGFVFFSDF